MDKTIILYLEDEYGKVQRVVKNESNLTESEKDLLYGELLIKLHASPICVQERFINELLRELNQKNEEQETASTERSKPKEKIQRKSNKSKEKKRTPSSI